MENPRPHRQHLQVLRLFGLVLAVFSFGASLYVNNMTNSLILSTIVEIDTLKQLENPSRVEAVRLTALERQKEVAISDLKFLQWPVGALLFIGFSATWYGFLKWHTRVQPMLDETAR